MKNWEISIPNQNETQFPKDEWNLSASTFDLNPTKALNHIGNDFVKCPNPERKTISESQKAIKPATDPYLLWRFRKKKIKEKRRRFGDLHEL
jgi:hypothetical protein